MPTHNSDISRIFNRIADLLEIEEANPFRVRAYRSGARAMEALSGEVADLVHRDEDLTSLPGIGKDLAEKIRTIVETGSLPYLHELEKRLPGGLIELLEVEGLGPKRVHVLYEQLGIDSREALRKAAQAGEISALSGFGVKTEQKILEDLGRAKEGAGRMKLAEAEQIAGPLEKYLAGVEGVKKVVVAGSYRRRRETVGDLDILATCRNDSPVMEEFVAYDEVERVLSRGKTRSSVILRSGLQVDLRVVPQESYGAALHYFTGSKAHNIAVRKLAVSRGLKINEYGVFEDDRLLAGATEKEVYATVDLPYIEPELREDRGEIEAAGKDELPELITLADIKGDLHAHSKETDGANTLEEMAAAARERGYEYLAITDHSQHVTMARGMDENRLRRQMELIDGVNERMNGFTLLKGIEVDILEDGSLDLSDEVLVGLDLVVCAVHSHFNLDLEKQTDRIIRAMDNRHVNILAHPTGRMLGTRRPYEVDMERLMQAAMQRSVFLELNSQPERMDLTDIHLQRAREIGLHIAIATDSHRTGNLEYMRFGVAQARRGWLSPGDVVNTAKLTKLRRLLKR